MKSERQRLDKPLPRMVVGRGLGGARAAPLGRGLARRVRGFGGCLAALGGRLGLGGASAGSRTDALLQRIHEVDDLRAELRLLDRLRLPMLDLGLDQFAEREVVLVLE